MLMSSSSFSSLLLVLLSLSSFCLCYGFVVTIIAFTNVIILIVLLFKLLSSAPLLSLLLGLISLSSLSLCHCRRRHYHQFYNCYYRYRPSVYVIVVVVIVVTFTSVLIIIVLFLVLFPSWSLSSPLRALLSLWSFYLCCCRRQHYHRFS